MRIKKMTMRPKCYYISFLLLLLCLLPSTLVARKHKAQNEPLQPLLNLDEQHYFDSLYFNAITLEQRGMADSALLVMNGATQYYDSMLSVAGYVINAHFPAEAPKPLGKHQRTPAASQVPGLAAAYFWLSNYHRQQNQALPAILSIERAVAIDSVNYWYTEAEGDLFLALKRVEDACVCYERLVRQYPEKSEPLANMSEIYLRMDSVDLCLKTLDRLEALEGVSPQLTQYKFSILHQAGRMEEGFDEYRKLIARYPYNAQYRIMLGDLQMQNGQIAQAKKTYDEAAAIEPDNAYVWIAEANYYSMTGDQVAADTLVASALTNVNLDVDTKVEVMQEYLKGSFRKLSQYREQVAKGDVYSELDTMALFHTVDGLFTEVAVMHPTADAVYELQAEWRSAMGQDSLATECMRFAADLKPTSMDYWERMLVYATRWMPKEGIVKMAAEVSQQHPSCQTAYLVSAWANLNLERQQEAIAQYRLAIDNMTPPDANKVSQLWGNMGDIYYQLDSLDQTWDCYEKAVKYNPTNYSALNNYAYYLSEARRDLVKAEQMALKVIQKYPDNPTYLDTYAWILYLEESYMLATFYQQHAIDCLPADETGNCTLFDHYGDMLLKNNDLKGAAEQWRKALQCTDCEDSERTQIEKKLESAETLLK